MKRLNFRGSKVQDRAAKSSVFSYGKAQGWTAEKLSTMR